METVTDSIEDQAAPRPRTGRFGWILYPTVLLLGIGLFFWYVNPSTHPVIAAQPVVEEPFRYDTSFVFMKDIDVSQEGDDLVFSLDDLKKYRLIRFEYETPKTKRFVLAYLAPDGRAVTAISVSEHCGSTEFKISGSMIYCARCPSKWDMMTMEAYACCAKYYPDPIPSKIEGNEVHIAKEAVEKWAGRL